MSTYIQTTTNNCTGETTEVTINTDISIQRLVQQVADEMTFTYSNVEYLAMNSVYTIKCYDTLDFMPAVIISIKAA